MPECHKCYNRQLLRLEHPEIRLQKLQCFSSLDVPRGSWVQIRWPGKAAVRPGGADGQDLVGGEGAYLAGVAAVFTGGATGAVVVVGAAAVVVAGPAGDLPSSSCTASVTIGASFLKSAMRVRKCW